MKRRRTTASRLFAPLLMFGLSVAACGQPLTEGLDDTPPSDTWTKPEVGAVTIDLSYGTEVRRLTSADGTRFDRNTYSRRQAENADGTRFMTYHGDAVYWVYDRETTDLVEVLPVHPNGEPQWHPTDPHKVRFIAGANSYVGDLRYYEYDLATGATTMIADLTGRLQAEMPEALYLSDKAEGSPSADGNQHAWIIYNSAEAPIGVVSYNLATDTITGLTPLEGLVPDGHQLSDGGPLDWVSASPSGKYVIAGFNYATVLYDADLAEPRILNYKADHSDIAIDTAGVDTYVYIDFSSGDDGGWLMAVNLDTLERTRLIDLYNNANTSIHISGKSYGLPGWVVASTYNCKVEGAWSCDKVMAVELGGDHRVFNLAHTYNCGDNYWTETHAVPNRNLTRVYFNSDGGSCGIDAEAYEISIEPGSFGPFTSQLRGTGN